MKLLSIEPTPSPNSMKVTVSETLPTGMQKEYTRQNQEQAAEYIQRLLAIPGVKSVYRAADFLALERIGSADWKDILARVKEVFALEDGSGQGSAADAVQEKAYFGEAQVYLQMFRTIPIQVKVTAGEEQIRAALPERFSKAAMQAGAASPNLVMERRWVDQGVRYGEMREIGEDVAREVDAAYDDARLQSLVDTILAEAPQADPTEDRKKPQAPAAPVLTREVLLDPDWRKRYAALDQLEPQAEHLPLLVMALRDNQASIRRLAVVYLGMLAGEDVLPHLVTALKDPSVQVRRTAGDTLSDLGDPRAIPAMLEALRDPSKLVRWRAARFLYEQGDTSALEGLRAAQDDPEFEVSLQIKMAVERIERGESASGSIWQQMTNRER